MNSCNYDIPDVSVIIPTYNVEKYIEQCLQSLLAQTYKNFEVICVDDGSTDETVPAIKRLLASDSRIQLIQMPHCGKAGLMRNKGIEKASGEYLLFLDGDDFFEAQLIEHTLQRIREDKADICLFDARLYYEESKSFIEAGHMLKKDYVPGQIPYEGKSCPYVLNISTGCPWTKLFRREFILENHLEFMPLHRSNDLFFVCVSMVLAKRITVLEEKLVNYRKWENSLQTANASTPWDWYKALAAVKSKLIESGVYSDVELSFKNYVVDVGFYNLESLKTAESFFKVYEKLKNEMLQEFDLLDFEREQCYSCNKDKYELYLNMRKDNAGEYLFHEVQMLKEEKTYWFKRARQAEQDTKNNAVYKTAKSLWVTLRRMLKKRRKK
nr:glycosyltransferase family 2 protein [uncultured Blautia sp.]